MLLQHMNVTYVVCGLLCYPESARGSEQRPRSIPILSTTPGLLRDFGLLFPELSCLPRDSLGVTCYRRDMWQNRTPQTACMGPMPVSLHILQFGKLLTLMTLLVRFSGGRRVEQVGH